MKYFENELLKIFYYEEQGVGLGVWKGKGLDQTYQDAMNGILRLVEEKNLAKWIGDLRDFGVISQENKEWTNTVWFPSVLKKGLKRIAVIVSSDVFGKMSVNSILSKVGDNVYTKHFDDLDEAKAWIVSDQPEG